MSEWWNRTSVAGTPLDLTSTLNSGQAFRWRRDARGFWWGVIDRVGVAVRMDSAACLEWQTFPERDRWDVIDDYFRLDVDLDRLYADWTGPEPCIETAVERFRGLRILRQPPEECFFAFQCATCNTIVKIERTLSRLAQRLGIRIDCEAPAPFTLYSFPSIEAIASADERELRDDLWGYRAPRVIGLARNLLDRPPHWLESLRLVPYAEARSELAGMFGIGVKVADCICLFSLDKDEAVPVDTHIRQIGCRLFTRELAGKSLTPRLYDLIAEAYRERFGHYAGWAQQYLFYAELGRSWSPERALVSTGESDANGS